MRSTLTKFNFEAKSTDAIPTPILSTSILGDDGSHVLEDWTKNYADVRLKIGVLKLCVHFEVLHPILYQ